MLMWLRIDTGNPRVRKSETVPEPLNTVPEWVAGAHRTHPGTGPTVLVARGGVVTVVALAFGRCRVTPDKQHVNALFDALTCHTASYTPRVGSVDVNRRDGALTRGERG